MLIPCSVTQSSPTLCDKSSLLFFFFNWIMPRASLVAQMVKNLPAVQETWVQFLSWEDPLEKRMATHVFLPGDFHG